MSVVNELTTAGKKIALAKKQLNEAKEVAKEVANRAHYDEKIYEITISELLGMDRMTVRRWLGKQ